MVGPGPADGGSNPSPRVSIAIQHHPQRAHLLPSLLAVVPGAEVVADPEPHGRRSAWRTYRLALERTPAEATHRLILQDDVLLCRNFCAAVDLVVSVRPDSPIVFFHGYHPQPNVYRLRTTGLAELDPNQWLPVVAACWPRELAVGLPGWVEAQDWPADFLADDEIAGRYVREVGARAYATSPSLVEHKDELSVGPPMKRVLTGRQAVRFIGEADPLAIDWEPQPAPQATRRGDTWGR